MHAAIAGLCAYYSGCEATSSFKIRFVTVFYTDDITVLLIYFDVILLGSYSSSPWCPCSGSNILAIILITSTSFTF